MNKSNIPKEIISHYEEGHEYKRLFDSGGKLELVRTQEILSRYLPLPPIKILDVGGGPGVYSNWLLSLGYKVHLIDPVETHIKQAKELFVNTASPDSYDTSIGDARNLHFSDSSFDAVLLMGPLYHLTEYNDRLKALKEALRVLKPNGILFAVGISKFASALDGLNHYMFRDPKFYDIVENDLKNGQHRNPENISGYFTTAFFHEPQQLKTEIKDAGFAECKLLAIEGPGSLLKNLNDYWQDPEQEDYLLNILRKIESEESLIGTSSHIMVIAKKL